MWKQIQIVPQGEPGGFLDNAAKYRCCCRCCHVKTGTLIIGLLEAVSALFQLINALYFITITQDKSRGIVGIVAVVIVSIVIAILFLGWVKEKGWLLLPHLVLQVIGIVITIGLICYVFIASNNKVQSTFDVSYDKDDGENRNMASTKAVIVLGLAIALGYELFAFTVIFGCFRYFRDKALFLAGGQATVVSQQPPAIVPPPQWGHPQQNMHVMPYPPPNGTTAAAPSHGHIQAMPMPYPPPNGMTAAAPSNGHIQAMPMPLMERGSQPPPYAQGAPPTAPSPQQHHPTPSHDTVI